MSARATVVLIHGAFADASGWAVVAAALADDDVDVIAPPNHLRGISADAAYVTSVLDQLEGPAVLVGHSYGGAVITAAGNHDKVSALVYVNGYALDEGETLAELQGRFPDSPLAANLRYAPFPVAGGEPGTDVSVDPDEFPHIFAADVPIETTRFMAHSQRPLSAAAFTEPAGAPAWRSKPAWGIVSSADNTINPDVERFGYERAGMKVTEVDGASHAVFLSHPAAVVEVIREAVAATVPVA
ncbi:alpha/beta fold hydrolase [Solirubrobacter soli]|uniref:alpha/beta fold hydrolase n=1 Tax=Solirubrobacter soli TaxID=363832 RepID=UPI0004077CA0|nr:alpha/beta hydrolase [Solirubrobacter soli]